MKKKEEKTKVQMLEEKDSNKNQKGLVEDVKKDAKVEEKTPKSKKTKTIFVISLICIIVIGGLVAFLLLKDKFIWSNEVEKSNKVYKSGYKLSGHSLENFDLYFLQAENNSKNMVYSPLSIKYALAMLSEGAAGNTKAQIDSIIGE